MRAILFAPSTGNQCKEFQREAKSAAKAFGNAPIFYFDPSKGGDACRRCVLDTLATVPEHSLDLAAFLCHGFRDHIQPGFYIKHVPALADAIVRSCVPGASVPLYACSTGKTITGPEAGEGGFADALRDALVARGMRGGTILAHYSAGHLARNPETRIFYIGEGQKGGYDVAPVAANRDLYRRFRGLLHTPTGRWDIATMTGPEIEARAARCEPYTG